MKDLEFSHRACFRYGEYHSFNDQPSTVLSHGSIYYHKDGLRHRDNDRPAVIQTDGNIYFYKKHVLYKKELI